MTQDVGKRAELEVRLGSRQLRVIRCGDGPVNVVLEAGGNCAADAWSAVQQALPERFTSWSYDRAGEGASPSNGDWRLEDCVDDLHAWLSAAEVPLPVVLVGHSLGCHIVRAYAAQHPEAVSAILLVDARPPHFEKRVLDAGIGIAMPPPGASIIREIGRADEVVDGLPRPGKTRAVAICAEHFDAAPGDLSEAEITEVAEMWTKAQAEIAEAVGQSSLIVVPGTGHDIPSEAPEFVVSVISDLAERH